jgi:CheY-like chemotaxis protein
MINLPHTTHKSLKILVVEDSFLTARLLARMIQELGAEVLGPAPSVSRALEILASGGCDAAVLDINLGHETSEAIARRLEDIGLPYFFVSGFASPKAMLEDERFKKRPLLPKPVESRRFKEIFTDVFGAV